MRFGSSLHLYHHDRHHHTIIVITGLCTMSLTTTVNITATFITVISNVYLCCHQSFLSPHSHCERAHTVQQLWEVTHVKSSSCLMAQVLDITVIKKQSQQLCKVKWIVILVTTVVHLHLSELFNSRPVLLSWNQQTINSLWDLITAILWAKQTHFPILHSYCTSQLLCCWLFLG